MARKLRKIRHARMGGKYSPSRLHYRLYKKTKMVENVICMEECPNCQFKSKCLK